MRAIRVHEPGGPDAMRLEEVPVPEPGPGEARVRLAYSGVNFIDTYHRSGLYPLPIPFTPGSEGAGVVDAVGEGVAEVSVGERVAYAGRPGSYAEQAIVPADRLVPVPDDVSLDLAAAVMLQGMTAHYLSHSTYPLGPDDIALVHAAAGGVGLLLVQLAKGRGARVIGTVSTEEKAELARGAGADDVVFYTRENFREAVMRLTDGRGVDVVYDAVGRTTFDDSLDSLRPRGMLVSYGQSSGPVPPMDPLRLSRASLFFTRPVLGHYTADRDELLGRASDLFELIGKGELSIRIDRTLPLAEAPEAHRLLEGRQTAGKLLLEC